MLKRCENTVETPEKDARTTENTVNTPEKNVKTPKNVSSFFLN